GVGAHAYRISVWDQVQGRKWYLFASIDYTISSIPLKLSICVQLLRITSGIRKGYAYCLYGLMALTTTSAIARILVWITRCKPFAASWNPALGHCQSAQTILVATYVFSAVSIFDDWACAILPVFLLWNVQLSLRNKLQVGFILSLGVLASIATSLRFRHLLSYVSQDDYLYGLATLSTWSQTEVTLAITAGSLPALRPMLSQFTMFSSSSGRSKSKSRTRTLGQGGFLLKLRQLSRSRRVRHLGSVDDDGTTYTGHAAHAIGGADVEQGGGEADSASQTYILGEEREGQDIVIETHIEVKSSGKSDS
ncbi:hypothetical protein BDV95DRAFT_506625, partial [Massariosphaeria phaeospora]